MSKEVRVAGGKKASAEEAPYYATVRSFFEKHPDIEFVRWQWVDVTALVRTRMTTVRQALRLASQGGSISVASPIANAFLIDGSFNEVNAGEKDQLVPDWSTLVPCYYQKGHAAVLCSIDEPDQDFNTCPRTILKKLEADVKQRHGMSFLVGIEIEFYLTPSAESTAPVKDVDAYCTTASLRTPYLGVLEESVRCLEKAGIPVWTFHSELVEGLFELQTEPMTPLAAADAVIYMHETIKAVAVAHGLHATMHPKPFDKTHGVGQHMHISLGSQSSKDDSFLQGVLDSVPGISAISMPNFDSYLRSDFAGGKWVSWDVENRLCSIRKIRRAYWEFRFIDCTANNYLVLACILGTGMAAWEAGTPLRMKPLGGGLEGEGEGGLDDEKTRRELGIKDPVPRDLGDAIEALKKDDALRKVLGKELYERFIRYKSKEEALLAQMTLQERRRLCVALF